MSSLLLGLALAVGAPNLKDRPADTPPLVGRWDCTALTINGKADQQWRGLEYEFTADGTWVIYRDGKDIGGIVRSYKLDAKAGAGAVDVCERADGQGQLALYKVDGDTLSLSIRTETGRRPTNFDPAAGVMTFTFRRVKSGK